MPQYCKQQDQKAIVTLYQDGKPFKVKVDNPPITITCLENNKETCAVVDVIITARVYNRDNQTYDIAQATNRCFAPILGVRVSDVKTNVQIKCRGNTSYRDTQCDIVDWYGASPSYGGANEPTIVVSGAIKSMIPITPASSESKKVGVQISDRNGAIQYSNPNIECRWQVQCGDECPDGTEKHLSPNYPGYCCLDCQGIANQIREITNSIRNKKRNKNRG